MRDTEQSRTYEVERMFKSVMDRQHECPTFTIAGSTVVLPAEHRFADLASVQRYVDMIVPGVKVRATRSDARRASFKYSTNTLNIPLHRNDGPSPYYHLRAETVLHELAHKLTSGGGHTREFRANLTDLVSKYIGPEAGFILTVMFAEAGL